MGVGGRESFVLGLRRRGTLVAMWMIGEVMFASRDRCSGCRHVEFNELVMTMCFENYASRSNNEGSSLLLDPKLKKLI